MSNIYKTLKLHISQLLGSITFTASIVAIYWSFKGFGNIEISDFIFATIILIIHYALVFPGDDDGNVLKVAIRSALFIPRNVFLLFFGHTQNQKTLKQITDNTDNLPQSAKDLSKIKENTDNLSQSARDLLIIKENTSALYQAEMFANISGINLSRPRNYFIIYTHFKKSDDEHRLADGKGYKITGFPVDETETIMRTWYYVTSHLKLNWKNCHLSCSCHDALVDEERKKALKSSMAVIGSIKGNIFSKILMNNIGVLQKQLNRTILPYLMKTKTDAPTRDYLCYLESQDKVRENKEPSPIHEDETQRPAPSEPLEDYAIVAKLPNIMNTDADSTICVDKENSILFMAGCKTAGQIAILDKFFNSHHMKVLNDKYREKYFYEIYQVQWNYVTGGLPHIVSISIIDSQEIVI